MIEKLYSYTSSQDGYSWVQRPTVEDCQDKINEIIDFLNQLEEDYILIPYHADAAMDASSAELMSIRDYITKIYERKQVINEM